MKKTIFIVIISFGFGLVVGLLQRCNTSPEVVSSIQYDSTAVFIHDTIHEIAIQKIKGDRYDSLINDTIWLMYNCDSIAEDWVMERWYIDTLKNDTDAFICVNSVIRLNELQDILLEYKNRRPTQINQYNYDEKNRYYLGAYVSKNYKGNPGIGISGGVGTNRYYFGGSIGTDAVLVTIQNRINFKK